MILQFYIQMESHDDELDRGVDLFNNKLGFCRN
jgi:hypothetical protein